MKDQKASVDGETNAVAGIKDDKSSLGFRWPPRRLLVALDSSEASEIAWEEAGIFSKMWGAEMEGVHVQPWLWTSSNEFGYADSQLTARASEEIAAELKSRLGISGIIASLPGDPVAEIVRWAEVNPFDLIVVGTRSRSGLARAFHSSVAEAVIRRSSVPVLVAKKPVHRPSSILAPYDLRPESCPGLRVAALCARTLSAQLTLLHVVRSPNAEFSGNLPHLKKTVLSGISGVPETEKPEGIEAEIAWGKPISEILEASRHSDLVVLTARSRGFLEDAILGTTVERVVRHSEASVLAVPSPNGK